MRPSPSSCFPNPKQRNLSRSMDLGRSSRGTQLERTIGKRTCIRLKEFGERSRELHGITDRGNEGWGMGMISCPHAAL